MISRTHCGMSRTANEIWYQSQSCLSKSAISTHLNCLEAKLNNSDERSNCLTELPEDDFNDNATCKKNKKKYHFNTIENNQLLI